MRKGINISHVNIENMGGHNQSQVKIKFKKFKKKLSPFQRHTQKVITMTERVAKGVPAQDWVVEAEMDCFGDSVAR